jgi:hypothetical protein
MSFQITTAFVQQYRENVEHLVQQKGSRFRRAVRVETGVIGKSSFFDQLGSVDAVKKTTRHGDTPLIETPHARRRVQMYDYEIADLVDKEDEVRILINPTSGYAIAQSNAMGRAMDDEIIAAATGTAYTGETGATSTVLPSAQKIAHASTGLTLAKLLTTKEILDGAEVDEEEPRFISVTAKQVTNLLNTTEIKDSDYNTVKALAAGQVNSFMGFEFIRSERLGLVSTNRRCYAWAQNGILLAIGIDIKSRISERADKSYSMQVYYSMTIGATRMQEPKIVEIACQE